LIGTLLAAAQRLRGIEIVIGDDGSPNVVVGKMSIGACAPQPSPASRRLTFPSSNFTFATSAPLYLLFERAHAHVTTLSTSTVEAAQFGVPSVLIEPEAKVLFRAVFDRGDASLALTPEQLLHDLRVIQARGHRIARSLIQPPLISTIRSILGQ
jgi:hypothetical protein